MVDAPLPPRLHGENAPPLDATPFGMLAFPPNLLPPPAKKKGIQVSS
jgi:hypothetical protein